MKIGDKVSTDFDNGRITHHVVTGIQNPAKIACQSKIMCKVKPALRGLTESDWIDVGWFKILKD